MKYLQKDDAEPIFKGIAFLKEFNYERCLFQVRNWKRLGYHTPNPCDKLVGYYGDNRNERYLHFFFNKDFIPARKWEFGNYPGNAVGYVYLIENGLYFSTESENVIVGSAHLVDLNLSDDAIATKIYNSLWAKLNKEIPLWEKYRVEKVIQEKVLNKPLF